MKQKKKREWKPEQVRTAKAIMVLVFIFSVIAAYFALLSMVHSEASAEQNDDAKVFPLKEFKRAFHTNYQRIARDTSEVTQTSKKEQTLSPYFFVDSADGETDRLPLKSTSAEVTISGVIAEVKITQTYTNEGSSPLEATYIFPASTRASVFSMRMTIGERVIDAEIKRKQQAREIYQEALENGQTASLLEQKRPNVFQMKVGNILPEDNILVELCYVEHLVPQNKTYEFVFPTVVGPRYSNSADEESHGFVKNPYLHQCEDAPFSFDFILKLQSGLPISKISSPSHNLLVDYENKNIAHVFLDDANNPSTRDVVLRYNLSGKKIESGVMLYEGENENYFMMMMQPPKRIETDEIIPREYVFILDVSGSMHGFPLDTAKTLMSGLLNGLDEQDRVNVMLFAGNNSVLAPKSLPVTRANIKKALDFVYNAHGGGGTELVPALKNAMRLPRVDGMSRIAVVVTDGYVSVEKEAFEIIARNLNTTNVFSFGIGSSVNRFLIEGMARAGQGEPFVVLNQSGANASAKAFMKQISSPILQGIEVKFEGVDAYDVEPVTLPDMFADKPLVLFGKYRNAHDGNIILSGHTINGEYKNTMSFNKALKSDDQKALKYLWARQRIMRLSDMNKLFNDDERIEEVTRLGLEYNLLTDYTSFVAVDKEVRSDGKVVKVKQPLPLPDGVSDLAVQNQLFAAQLGGQGKSASGAPGLMTKYTIRKKSAVSRGAVAEESEFDRSANISGLGGIGKNAEQKSKKPKAESKRAKVDFRITADNNVLKAAIEKQIKSSLAGFIKAYKKALKKNPALSGVLVIKFTLNKNGKIGQIKTATDKLKNKTLEALVKKKLSQLGFSTPQTSSQITVTLIFRKS